MPKLLTIAGMTITVLMFLLFLLDLILYFVVPSLAPFQGASLLMDICFVICAGILAYLSWSTYRELP